MTQYEGNGKAGLRRVLRLQDGLESPLDPALEVLNLSGGILSWGDTSVGSQQLAVALVWDTTRNLTLVKQTAGPIFWAVVVHLRETWWALSSGEIGRWVSRVLSTLR